MSTSITFPQPDGSTFIIPAVDDENWGQNVTNFLVAIPNGVPPRNGTFSLTGDLYFGPSFGLKSQYYKSPTSNIASAGVLRLAKTDLIDWRNNANSADLALGINGSDQLTFNGVVIGAASNVLSIIGTTHQIIASSPTGNVTLSTPQNIDTTSSPTFVSVTANLVGNVTGNVTGTASGNLPLTGGTLSGALDLGSNQIHHVADGTVSTDAVNLGQLSGMATFQSGDMKAAAYTAVPSGWLLCDGTSYATATYPALFAAIGYTYGGAGANFNVPNMVNAVPIGAGSVAAIGVTAGATTVTVIQNAHTHTQDAHQHATTMANTGGGATTLIDNTHPYGTTSVNHTFSDWGSSDIAASAQSYDNTSSVTATNQSTTATNQASSTVQPSLGVTWFIKI